MGLNNSGSIGSVGGGAGAGKSSISNIALSFGSSSEVLALTAALNGGTRLANVEIEAYASGGDKGAQLVDEFKFNEVLLTSLGTGGPQNSLQFDTVSFTHGHVEQDKTGKALGSVTGWDYSKNE
ncbi:unnamed protein product, partial [Phaeothamnion confervicola]